MDSLQALCLKEKEARCETCDVVEKKKSSQHFGEPTASFFSVESINSTVNTDSCKNLNRHKENKRFLWRARLN
jgi:hypothetical protein